MNPGKVAKAMPEIVNATLKKVEKVRQGDLANPLAIPPAPSQTAAPSRYFRTAPHSIISRPEFMVDVLIGTPEAGHHVSSRSGSGHLGHLYPFFQDLSKRKKIEKSLVKYMISAQSAPGI